LCKLNSGKYLFKRSSDKSVMQIVNF
jgi:hypothetical protein